MVTGALIVTVYAWLPVAETLSVAVTVKLKSPVAEGVPLRTPLLLLRVRPVGKVPVVVLNVYVPLPPVAWIVWL